MPFLGLWLAIMMPTADKPELSKPWDFPAPYRR